MKLREFSPKDDFARKIERRTCVNEIAQQFLSPLSHIEKSELISTRKALYSRRACGQKSCHAQDLSKSCPNHVQVTSKSRPRPVQDLSKSCSRLLMVVYIDSKKNLGTKSS